jgi:hypothetical protein
LDALPKRAAAKAAHKTTSSDLIPRNAATNQDMTPLENGKMLIWDSRKRGFNDLIAEKSEGPRENHTTLRKPASQSRMQAV